MSKGACVLGGVVILQVACGEVRRPPPVDAAPARVSCGAQVLPNGGFEDPTPAWRQDPPTPGLLCGEAVLTPFQGARVACLGLSSGVSEALTQDVPLPAGATMVTLTGQVCIATAETDQVTHDVLYVDLLDGGSAIAALGTLSNLGAMSSCEFKPFTMTTATTRDPVTATLQIRANLDAANVTTFYLDALQLTVGCAP
jgi:hypothetical protein